MKELKVTSEDFAKLRGLKGERFTSEAEYRQANKGEYMLEDGEVCTSNMDQTSGFYLVLTRAKTAREWLEELPDGWREEALRHCKNPDDVVDSLESAILLSVNWVNSNSGVYAWDEVALAIKDGRGPIPPHPSRAKPKVKRLEVFERNGWLWAGDLSLDCWIGHADFRGFVFVLPNGEEACGLTATLIWWSDKLKDWAFYNRGHYPIPLRPKFVEVAR